MPLGSVCPDLTWPPALHSSRSICPSTEPEGSAPPFSMNVPDLVSHPDGDAQYWGSGYKKSSRRDPAFHAQHIPLSKEPGLCLYLTHSCVQHWTVCFCFRIGPVSCRVLSRPPSSPGSVLLHGVSHLCALPAPHWTGDASRPMRAAGSSRHPLTNALIL